MIAMPSASSLSLRQIALGLLLFPQLAIAQDIEQVNLKKPVTLSGNLSFSMQTYSVNGIPPRTSPAARPV
jgi:hypothetical protein